MDHFNQGLVPPSKNTLIIITLQVFPNYNVFEVALGSSQHTQANGDPSFAALVFADPPL